MAANHIKLNTALTKGAQLWALVQQVMAIRNSMADTAAVYAEMRDGTDYTLIATELGISAAEAASVYSLVANANTVLAGADLDYLVNRLG